MFWSSDMIRIRATPRGRPGTRTITPGRTAVADRTARPRRAHTRPTLPQGRTRRAGGSGSAAFLLAPRPSLSTAHEPR